MARRSAQAWWVTLFYLACLNTPGRGDSSVINIFEDNSTSMFNKLVVDKNTGYLFVGAVNNLYRLTSDLNVIDRVVTGPVEDSFECGPDYCSKLAVKTSTDNVNKVLVIDYNTSNIITCGSVSQGMCTVRDRNNISVIVTSVCRSVAANNKEASTVAFIAPGPPNPPLTRAMYIGVTYTGNSQYRDEVPAIASRRLDDVNQMLDISYRTLSGGSEIFVNKFNRDNYPVNYVYGFSSGRFSYFLTTQKRSVTSVSQYISKLVRLCHKDEAYSSYTEIPLECTTEERSYNLVRAGYVGKIGSELAADLNVTARDDVLFAVFSSSNERGGKSRNRTNDQSALCIYSLNAINKIFLDNIETCFSGKGNGGLDFISVNYKCYRTTINITEDFCGVEGGINSPLRGDSPITANPVLTFNTRLTAVTATSADDFTVVFVGTDSGHVKKIQVESSVKAVEYGDIVIHENSPINRDLILDTRQMHLYAMTKNRVSKINVQECRVYSSCLDCWAARDPYCGWCSLENKCTLRKECEKIENTTLDWISYKSEKCINIASVTPNRLPLTSEQTLNIIVNNDYFPFQKKPLYCAFEVFDNVLIANATRTTQGVSCTTPLVPLRIIPFGGHHFAAKLHLKTAEGPNIVATNVTFYNCSTYTSCIQCAGSSFSCVWCFQDHRCTHDADENSCPNGKKGSFSTGAVNHVGPAGHRTNETSHCPSIDRYENESNEILIANGTDKSIDIKVNIINQIIVQSSFECRFVIDNRVAKVKAKFKNNTIHCETMEYNSDSSIVNATFAVNWGESHALDNPYGIRVVVYNCRTMAEDCSKCLTLPDKFGCGWSETSKSCAVENRSGRADEKWLNRNETCSDVEITSFSPRRGPRDGRTNITIIGKNLGRTFDDRLHRSVTVAGVRCVPHTHSYESTEKILCRLNVAESSDELIGPVVIKIKQFSGQSKENYSFVDPTVTDIDPKCGPKSGGTTVKIIGQFLDAGSEIRVFFGDDSPCTVINSTTTVITCVTGASNSTTVSGQIKVLFDESERVFHRHTYKYTDDPSVESVESNVPGSARAPTGIVSGGIRVLVTGTDFECVQTARLFVNYMGSKYFGGCTVQSRSKLICDSPKFTPLLKNHTDRLLELNYGFEMDNALGGVRNTSAETGFSKFKVYPDPRYDTFENGIKYQKDENLILNGHGLNRGCDKTDVRVKIGTSYCNITTLSLTQLVCVLPVTPTFAHHFASIRIFDFLWQPPEVIVTVGSRLEFNLGKLYFRVNNSTVLYSCAAVFAIFLVIIVILVAFFVFYRRKVARSTVLLKDIQQQMDILELQVAAECKEAFAELQTEITDIAGNIACGGIPFLDYNTYSLKILFPNAADFGALKRKTLGRCGKNEGIRLFGQLMLNKTFLLLFIKSLESNRYFSMKDRVNVASLIMMALQGQMEYCTDILRCLLAELIEKYVKGNNHPKLLLRRTESVVEKMLSTWFSFLLYDFLKDCAGEPLYLLFSAIKQQVVKGPVDAITAEARYSLSEENLIRQSIDFVPMTVLVSISRHALVAESPFGLCTENVPVRVLDCDAISQVKEKALDTIFRVTPRRQRPDAGQLDVEWITGSACRLILYDQDSTTQVENEWRKLNTLRHYMVPDGARLNLVSAAVAAAYNSSDRTGKTDRIDGPTYGTLNLKTFKCDGSARSTAAAPSDDDDDGDGDDDDDDRNSGRTKRWHLVKNFDGAGPKDGERDNKLVTEVYLARLLTTKGTLHGFVDGLFESIFTATHRDCCPLPIKYMFDFLDDQAARHAITDPDVVHTWKCNCLPLRFWVNIIKNPDTVFDVRKTNIIDSCLSVIAQTFMDSCSTFDHRLGIDSPSSKLLYAKDIPVYKDWLGRYYSNIRNMPAVSDQRMNAMLVEQSRRRVEEFNVDGALCELYEYAAKYYEQLVVTLQEDDDSQEQRLAHELEKVHDYMTGKKTTNGCL